MREFNYLRFIQHLMICLGAFIFSFIWPAISFATMTQWKTLAPGLKYAELQPLANVYNGRLHAFQIDLNKYRFELVSAAQMQKSYPLMSDYVLFSQAVLGVNGGFFDPKNQPLGLRILNGKMLNPAKNISWWGTFFISNNRPQIIAQPQKINLISPSQVQFAIQSGPRLIAHGQIVDRLKGGYDERTALGITRDQHIIVVSSENLLITTTQLAQVMVASEAQGGLGCIDAINLDGGSSSQLYAKVGNFSLNVPGFATVADAVVVKEKH